MGFQGVVEKSKSEKWETGLCNYKTHSKGNNKLKRESIDARKSSSVICLKDG